MTRADPAPLSARQLRALGMSAGRELGWGLRAVSCELAGWHARALDIPDPTIRADAVDAVTHGRSLIDGAALFWTLPPDRRPGLLRLLVALQTLLNFLDLALERSARERGGRPEHRMAIALDALDLDRPLPAGDARPDADDGGYVQALAQVCRSGCATLPHYRMAHALVVREARRARSFDLEHDRDPVRRLAEMRRLAACDFQQVSEATPWELTGGASSLLTAMALLAVAADEQSTEDDLRRVGDAYVWVASAAALLDSYVDRPADVLSGAHNWLDYYPSTEVAVQRAAALIERALREAAALRNSERHLVIVASMAAMFLSSDSARSPALRADSRLLAASSGALSRMLIPILRAWRVAYRQSAD